ncbi:MlaD family protein [Paradesertivirga mongoliensis]|uniref:MlaD family protein n=1 Tax=Paradesertivirga mongoliensis TaxID=2100740 RepID=A0ABW4ZNW8_9SPHI|nr:MlaD family protein [Pedobacter mongoliensis]
MQVTDDRRKVTVGLFIFIGLLIFVFGIFTLGSQKKTFVQSIELNVVFDDIQGLKTGGNVWFSGVKVGTIKKIQFYGTAQVQVIMNIEKGAQQYIHKDAMASIGSEGFIGNKLVVIDGGTPRFPVVEDGDQLKVNTSLSTDQIMRTFQENNKNLLEITGDFKKISSNLVQGKGAAGALLSDEKMSEDLKAAVFNLKTTTESANRMVGELNRFTNTLNTKGGLANKMLTDTVVFARLQASVNELQKASRSASTLAQNLNNASAQLNEKDNPVGMLLNDQQSTEQIKRILLNLENSTYNLNEDLKALQGNILFRGYFKKKREAAAENK